MAMFFRGGGDISFNDNIFVNLNPLFIDTVEYPLW